MLVWWLMLYCMHSVVAFLSHYGGAGVRLPRDGTCCGRSGPTATTPHTTTRITELLPLKHGPTGDRASPEDVGLEQWADEMGIERHVEIGRGRYGRGLFAICNISRGGTALRVPLSATISDDHLAQLSDDRGASTRAAAYALAKALDDAPALDYSCRLAAALWFEARLNASRWRPYVQALPASSPNTLPRWSASELDHLQNCSLKAEALAARSRRNATLSSMQQCIQACAPLGEGVGGDLGGAEEVGHYLDLVDSRQVRVEQTLHSDAEAVVDTPKDKRAVGSGGEEEAGGSDDEDRYEQSLTIAQDHACLNPKTWTLNPNPKL